MQVSSITALTLCNLKKKAENLGDFMQLIYFSSNQIYNMLFINIKTGADVMINLNLALKLQKSWN